MAPKLKKSSLKHKYSTIRGSTGDKWTELLAGGWNFRRTDDEGFRSSMRLWSHPSLSSEFIDAEHPAMLKIHRTNIVGGVQFVDGRRNPRWKPASASTPSPNSRPATTQPVWSDT